MSQSTLAAPESRPWQDSSNDPTVIDTEAGVQRLLGVLDDADCRAILDVTGDIPLSANELSEGHGIPLSTTYRKLELLTEAGLLEERVRICQSGKHTSEYARRIEEVTVSVGADAGFELTVTPRGASRSGPVPQ